jgi:molybdopterin molybdotransferase
MGLMLVEQALAAILRGVKPVGLETVPLRHAHGRILAKPVKAIRDQPPFHASAMDGYAVCHADVTALPAQLKLIGVSAAGRGFKGTVRPGAAVRILTGAPLPKGTDTIVIQENCIVDGALVTVVNATPFGKNIRPQGLDFKRGSVLVEAGCKLNARDIGLAAAGNAPSVLVRKRPRVVLLTTGDELVLPGDQPRADQIVSSNSFALEAMFRAWDADIINLGIIPDRLKATERAILKGLNADLLVTTGGASVGDHDYVQEALRNVGVKIGFWKIALRPGKPLMFGRKGKTRVLGLPGNPVSALVCARIFIKPLLQKMMGLATETGVFHAALGAHMPANDSRQDYVRATLTVREDGTRIATPFSLQDSSMQRTLRNAQCLIIRAPLAAAVAKGESVPILMLDF